MKSPQTTFPVLAYSQNQYDQFIANNRLPADRFSRVTQRLHLYGYLCGSTMALLPDSMTGLDASQLLNEWVQKGNHWVGLTNDHVVGRAPLPDVLRALRPEGQPFPREQLVSLIDDLKALTKRLEGWL